MKKIFPFICLLGAMGLLSAQNVDFPDPNFKFACVNFPVVDFDFDGIPDGDVDTNDDGEIQLTEALAVTHFYPRGAAIFSLEGIEAFSNIVRLNCSQNNLTELDLSQNTQLEFLSCFFNDLTELDVAFLPDLKELNCDFNDFSSLDVTQNPMLERLFAPQNELTDIDLSQNTNLLSLNLDNNNLTSLDLTQSPSLMVVSFNGNQISEIDFTQNTGLSIVDIYDNRLTNLDFSLNPNITKLWCYENNLESLNIQNGNNMDILILNAQDNPNLSCVQVDDVTYANDQVSWSIDAFASYSENCQLGSLDFMPDEVRLFPNPVKDVVHIETGEYTLERLRLYNYLGQELPLNLTTSTSVSLETLPRGLYVLELEIEGRAFIKKIVKE